MQMRQGLMHASGIAPQLHLGLLCRTRSGQDFKCSGLLGISNGTPGLQVVDRVRRKAAMYGQDEVNDDHFNPFSSNGAESPSYKVEPETVAQLYEQFVMPLTKEVQLTYLLHRLDHEMRPQLQ